MSNQFHCTIHKVTWWAEAPPGAPNEINEACRNTPCPACQNAWVEKMLTEKVEAENHRDALLKAVEIKLEHLRKAV